MCAEVRCDSYQTGTNVTAVMYIRGHTVENIKPTATQRQLVVEATVDGKPWRHVWHWAGETESQAKVDQGKVKVEIIVPKVARMMWQKAEENPDEQKAVPLYEKWSSKQLPKEEEEKPVGLEATLRQWYRDADEDSRRAMIKSMQESGGTVFNPNWKEVGSRKMEPYKSKEEREKQEQEEKERAEREKKAIEEAKKKESS